VGKSRVFHIKLRIPTRIQILDTTPKQTYRHG
jgi:hypothetical protein